MPRHAPRPLSIVLVACALAGTGARQASGQTTASPGSRLDELRPEVFPDAPVASWVSVGLLGAYNSPFGYLALQAEYFPIRWLAVQATLAAPIADEPATIGEGVLIEYPLFSALAMGAGATLSQSFTKAILPGDHPGLMHWLSVDIDHFTYRFNQQLAARIGIWLELPLGDDAYCKAHPEACPQLDADPIGVSGTLALLYTFPISRASE